MTLIPAEMADRMVALARREALWRGILIGYVIASALSVVLIRGLLT